MRYINKRSLLLIITILLVCTFGISYAAFRYYETGKQQQLLTGEIYLKFKDNTSSLSISNIYPETKEEARSRTDNVITFNVSGTSTVTNKDVYYEVYLNEGEEKTGMTRFNPKDIVFDLIEIDESGNRTTVVDAKSFSDFNKKRIWVNTVNRNSTINKTYELRMWLSEDVIISDTEESASYTTSDFENRYLSIKVGVYGDFVEKEIILPTKPVCVFSGPSSSSINVGATTTYNLNCIDSNSFTDSTINASDFTLSTSGVVTVSEPTNLTITNGYQYTITVTGAKIGTTNLTLKAGVLSDSAGNTNDAVTSSSITVASATSQETLAQKITSTMSLTEPDVDGTRYVYGSDVDNNYVWYSGKLWRIVSIDEDGNIKLVTQGNMTTIAWATSSSNTDYSTSQMRTWLNTEFLPTLENADTLVASSTWDYTTYESFPASKDDKIIPTTDTTVTDKVGLLTAYDYMMTGGTNSSSTSKTFLNNGYDWWLSSPYSGSNVWYVCNYGYAYYSGPTSSYGARPSINLVSNIQIDGGSGIETDPYRIKGDKTTGQTNELLNNRVSGEYINFNNTKYRIVGIENGLTKITMADYDVNKNTLSTSVAFGASTSELTFSTTYGIGKYLNDWYNATSETDTNGTYMGLYLDETYKSMIATPDDGVRWYAGPDSGGTSYDYTKATQGTGIEATIGLGRYGEMFSSQFGDGAGSSTTTWLITKSSGSYVWGVYSNGNAYDNSPTASFGARPSMYLKSDVKIVNGSGTPHDEYEISQ